MTFFLGVTVRNSGKILYNAASVDSSCFCTTFTNFQGVDVKDTVAGYAVNGSFLSQNFNKQEILCRTLYSLFFGEKDSASLHSKGILVKSIHNGGYLAPMGNRARTFTFLFRL